jgi:hypothetical protein
MLQAPLSRRARNRKVPPTHRTLRIYDRGAIASKSGALFACARYKRNAILGTKPPGEQNARTRLPPSNRFTDHHSAVAPFASFSRLSSLQRTLACCKHRSAGGRAIAKCHPRIALCVSMTEAPLPAKAALYSRARGTKGTQFSGRNRRVSKTGERGSRRATVSQIIIRQEPHSPG